MLTMPAMVATKSLMLAMVAKKVECWQWWRKKFNTDNAGAGGEKCNAGDDGEKSVILTMPAMVAPKVKCWQCRRWWRKKFNAGVGGEKS